MDALTPNDLFSPSKARQHRAQQQDWASVDAWLSARHSGRRIPAFERNEATLKALLSLSTANERADEERDLLESVEKEALVELTTQSERRRKEQEATTGQEWDLNGEIMQTIQQQLSPDASQHLQELAEASVHLNAADTQPTTLAHATIALTSLSATLAEQLAHVESLQSFVATHESQLLATLEELRSMQASSAASANLPQQTQQLTAATKQLRSKLTEYTTRLAALQENDGGATPYSSAVASGGVARGRQEKKGTMLSTASLRMLNELEAEVESLVENMTTLEGEVEAYKGLPTDRNEARKVVRSLERETEALRRRRDDLFGRMVS